MLEAIPEVLRETEGAFSMLFLTSEALVAVRDPRGFRPLALGRLDGAWVVASETCAFDLIGAEYVRDVEPGEMVVIDEGGLRSSFPLPERPRSFCVFEHVYFSRPDSMVYGRSVNESRHKMGRRLAIEQPADANLVVPVPDSGVAAAIGYAAESGISFRFGLVRNHYIGRTFIEPKQSIRSFGVRLKLNPVRDLIRGRSIVLIDDSHRAGDDLEEDRPARAGGGRARRPRPHQLSADHQPVLLRRGHAEQGRADRGADVGRGGLPLHRGRLARLPLDGGDARSLRPALPNLLRRLLDGALPDPHLAAGRDAVRA